MKTIMTVMILLTAGLTDVNAQTSWKPEPAYKYHLPETAPQYLTRTETYFGADFGYTDKGAIVTAIMPNSPAESFHFRKGDIITSIGVIAILSKNDYLKAMEVSKPDEVVKISYIRKGVTKEKNVKMERIQAIKQAGVN